MFRDPEGTESKKRQRKRVPVACLNCKNRKVKCDRNKPCSGCLKNNVSHLCVYLEPTWADTLAQIAAGGAEPLVRDSKEYKKLKLSMEALVQQQKEEIARLRASLDGTNGGTANVSVIDSGTGIENLTGLDNVNSMVTGAEGRLRHGPMTVLRKLNGSASKDSVPEVMNDDFYTMKGLDAPDTDAGVLNLYSWLNIIKIDPQLTALWFRITGLQKSYHIYKTSLLSKPRDRAAASESPGESSSGCGHHQCPVVACEFNLMVEESNNPSTPLSHSASLKSEQIDDPDRLLIKTQNDDAVSLLTLLQRMWLEIRNSGRGSEKLNYNQLSFLLNFYTNEVSSGPSKLTSLQNRVELSNLLRFFKNHILQLLQRGYDDDVRLDVAVFSPEMTDDEVMGFLKLKGVYLSMLGVIVEESLDCLRVQTGLADEVVKEFHNLFPLEGVHQGMGYKRTNTLALIRDFLLGLPKKKTGTREIDNLLSLQVLIVAVLNRFICVYEKEGVFLNVKTSFTKLLTVALEMMDRDGRLEIWCDPARVRLLGADVREGEQYQLRLLFCQVWSDFMRIINHSIFSIVPIFTHSDEANRLILKFLHVMTEAEASNSHLRYLENLSAKEENREVSELLVSFQVSHLMARATSTLRDGIFSQRMMVSVSDIQALASEVSTWAHNAALAKLRMSRYFETRSVLHYLEFLFDMVVFLQCEEDGDEEAVARLIPMLFSKSLDLNKFLQGSIVQFSNAMNSNYVLAAIADSVARVSHLIAGPLIRFKGGAHKPQSPGGSSFTSTTLTYVLSLGGLSGLTIPLATKQNVIEEMDRTMSMLEESMNKEAVSRRTKIWKFYMTFIRNSHRMNSEAYAKLHAKAFGSGRLLEACPVMPKASPNYPISATRMEQRCPVIHSGSPVPTKMWPSQSAQGMGCPVNHGSLSGSSATNETPVSASACPYMGPGSDNSTPSLGKPSGFVYNESAPQTNVKRQCPFDHEARALFEGSVSVKFEQNEGTPPLRAPSISTPQMMFQQQVLERNSVPPQLQAVEMMDWDSLPNFNLDFMGEEGLMGQINGGDFNNTMIEGLFQ